MKYFLTLDKTALKEFSEYTESSMSAKMKLYIEAAQVVPDKLKQKILSVLNFLDRKNKLNESVNIEFWEEILKEKHENSVDIECWLFFLQIVLGSNCVKYANRFPLFFNRFREDFVYVSDLIPASMSNPPKYQDIRFALAQYENAAEKDDSLDKSSKVAISDNLIEILAYFLFASDRMEYDYYRDMVRAVGLNGDRSIKDFIKKIKDLKLEIKQHVERKANIIRSLENNSFYKFWHRECSKRKFYLDYMDNNKFSDYIDSILAYITKTLPKYKFYCKKCIFEGDQTIRELIVSSQYLMYCYNKNCAVKKRCFELNEAKDLKDKYGYYLLDLISPLSGDGILEYINKHKSLPLDEVIESMQAYDVIKNDMDKYITDGSLVSFFSEVERFIKKEKTESGKIHIDNESFMIGIHIWDQIFIHENSNSIHSVIKGLDEYELGEVLNQKYPNYNKGSKQAILQNFTLDSVIYDYCYGCYKMVTESINNINARLLSKEAARKRV